MLIWVLQVARSSGEHSQELTEQAGSPKEQTLLSRLQAVLREVIPEDHGAANLLLRRLLVARISLDKGVQVGPCPEPPQTYCTQSDLPSQRSPACLQHNIKECVYMITSLPNICSGTELLLKWSSPLPQPLAMQPTDTWFPNAQVIRLEDEEKPPFWPMQNWDPTSHFRSNRVFKAIQAIRQLPLPHHPRPCTE